jgi:DNA-binding SARP family transcriptional activator/tetratricopeptide (TPR) repeat protein
MVVRVPKTPGSIFINLLGGFHLSGPQEDAPLFLQRKKTRALLAMLAVCPDQGLPRGKITALLWEEETESAARHGLRQCLLDLRHTFAKVRIAAVRAEGDVIRLEPSRVVVDVMRFERCVAQGTPASLNEALARYRGDFLDGFSFRVPAFEEWLRSERERLRSLAVAVMRKMLAHHVRERTTEAALQLTLRLLTLEPFDESVHRTMMQLYADSGRRSAALRQYEDCVDLLSRELQTEPETETRELYRRLIGEPPRLGTRASPPTAERRTPMPQIGGIRTLPRARSSTPLVGRAAELACLDGLRQKAHAGQPQLAFVVGEAGIGKTRLIQELASRIRHRHAHILLGRGREGEDVLPFAPWVEAIRPALSENVLARLAPVTRQDLARLFPEIAEGPAPAPTGLEDGPRIFEAVAHLLRQLACDCPLTVMIEDLHWCDDMTVRLLRFLPRRLEGLRVLLLGTARAEEMSGGAGRGAVLESLRDDSSCLATTLGPLSRDHVMDLLQTLLASRGAAPSPVLAERIWRLSEGNPFVVLECAQVVRDRDSGTSDELLELPSQVRSITERYLANLGDLAARLIAAAAVIGRDFDVTVLRHATGMSQSELADALEELVRRRIVREIGGRFDFRHDRVRETAYARLLSTRRTLLHRKVAEALTTAHAADLDVHCAAIGIQYRHAEVWSEASHYLARAGFQAWGRGAGREALACFEDALHALMKLSDTPDRRVLQVRLRLAANAAGIMTTGFERGRAHLQEAEALVGTVTDERLQARVTVALAHSYRGTGALERSRQLGHRAVEQARRARDHWLESVANVVLGGTEFNAGNFRRSLEHLTVVLRDQIHGPDPAADPLLPTAETLPALRVWTRFFMVYSHAQLGELDEAMRLVEESFRQADQFADAIGTTRMIAHITEGRVYCGYGDFSTAVRAYESALALYREDCHRHYYRPLYMGLALSYALDGRVREALDIFEAAEAAERQISSNAFKDLRLLHLARVLIEARQPDEAGRLSLEALSVSGTQGNQASEATAHSLLAEVAALRNPTDVDMMERHLLQALELATLLEMRPLIARCHQRLAWLYEQARRSEGEHHRAAATCLLEQMGRHVKLDAAGVH